MSFELYLDEPDGSAVCLYGEKDETHEHTAPVMQVGGTSEMNISVTYNHTPKITKAIEHRADEKLQHYREWLSGKTGAETLPRLRQAAERLAKPDIDEDKYAFTKNTYWSPNNANARSVVMALIDFAERRPDGVWRWED